MRLPTRHLFPLLFLFLLSSFSLPAQSITGDWNGLLEMEGTNLRLVLHVEETDEGLSATVDSPDQNVFGMPVAKISMEGEELAFELPEIQVVYRGTVAPTTPRSTAPSPRAVRVSRWCSPAKPLPHHQGERSGPVPA
jgi:hypothetical protein